VQVAEGPTKGKILLITFHVLVAVSSLFLFERTVTYLQALPWENFDSSSLLNP